MAENDSTYGNIAVMVKECEEYRDQLAVDRNRAQEYYDGEMNDAPSDPGRSKVVSRDVRSAIKDVLPSVIRTILGNDEVVEFLPVGEGDEEAAQQAGDYINYVAFPESNGFKAVHDAVHDALLKRNGILSCQYMTKRSVSFSNHSGLPDQEFEILVSDPSIEVVEHTERVEGIDGNGLSVHDVRIKRISEKKYPHSSCVPLEEFLIHPEAVTIEDSPITGRKMRLRRSDLVEMGYDKDIVEKIPATGQDYNEEGERDGRRKQEYNFDGEQALEPALEEVDYYDLYVRTDQDGDGIAELRRMCFGGGVKVDCLLLDEEVDDIPFADITAEFRPHQWEGHAPSDDVMEIQRIKTVLFRQTLDNLYWQNNPQPIMQDGAITNPEAVFNPEFGMPIRVREGIDVRGAYNFNNVPFVAKDSFGMLEYLDNEITNRTGISDASSGMTPDALQNMTAKASAMIEQAGIGQTELMVRCIAEGLKRYFKLLLRTIIRHQDVPRTVRLRDNWVAFDPRHWNAEMDVTVNTGLGAGTRERDMMMMQIIMGLQEKMLAGFGPDNPFVKPENVHNAVSKMVESAGLRTPSLYFTEPDPQEVEAKIQAARSQPNPEMIKLEGQMKLEQQKMQSAQAKERAQMEADLTVKKAELEKESIARREQLEADAIRDKQKLDFEREKLAQERDLKLLEMQQARELENARMERETQRAQAGDIGRAIEKMQVA